MYFLLKKVIFPCYATFPEGNSCCVPFKANSFNPFSKPKIDPSVSPPTEARANQLCHACSTNVTHRTGKPAAGGRRGPGGDLVGSTDGGRRGTLAALCHEAFLMIN